MRTWITLTLWVACMLFPLALFSRISAPAHRFMDWLLAPEWLHVVMHLLIFAGLVILVSIALAHREQWLSPVSFILVILGVGIFQELFQYISSVHEFRSIFTPGGSLYDLGVDLAGGALGVFAFNRFSIFCKPRSRSPQTAKPHTHSSSE